MVNPNWGLAQGGGFQNALATGLQMGQMARKQQDEREYKNALAKVYAPKTAPQPSTGGPGIVATPEQQAESDRLAKHFGMEGVMVDDGFDPQAMATIMQHNPQLGIKLREEARERQQNAEVGRLTQAAMGGDKTAMQQLAVKNFDRWKALDGQQRDAAKHEAELFGNAAMDILARPPAQRAAAVQAYAAQLGQQYPEIAQIAALPPDQLEGKLRSAVASAGMIRELVQMERPDYMAVPYDATLVNTRDPAAVSQFGQGAPQSGGIAEGATATNPQTGEKIIYRNGQWAPMQGGGGGGVTGNFLDGL